MKTAMCGCKFVPRCEVHKHEIGFSATTGGESHVQHLLFPRTLDTRMIAPYAEINYLSKELPKLRLWSVEGTFVNQLVEVKFINKMSRTLFNQLMDIIYAGVAEGGSLEIGKYQITLEKVK